MIILQEAINTFSFSPHIDKESPADKPVTCLRDFFRQKQDPRSLKVEAARVLLVHVDEPGGHERAHVVGDRGGRQADALGQILPAERFVFDELDDIEPPLVGDRLQPVAEVL